VNKRNFVVYDIETSGLDYENGAEIVQIAAVTLNYSDYEVSNTIEPFTVIVQPQSPEKTDAKAIEVIGESLWTNAKENGVHPKTALRKFKEYLAISNPSENSWNYPIVVGFNNTGFDDKFVEYWMRKYKIINGRNDCPWSNIKLDMMPLMFSIFGRDNLKNNRLDTYAELLGMKRTSDTHDALEDVLITAEMFKRYMSFMNFKIRPKIKITNNA
jgi:DNA polymerase III epsilon subunit-like protein